MEAPYGSNKKIVEMSSPQARGLRKRQMSFNNPTLSQKNNESQNTTLVTAHIYLCVDISKRSKWEAWRRGIRNAARLFKGYRGIRHIDLGELSEEVKAKKKFANRKAEIHRVVVIIKFSEYKYLQMWLSSEERKYWLDAAETSGLVQEYPSKSDQARLRFQHL